MQDDFIAIVGDREAILHFFGSFFTMEKSPIPEGFDER
jgi:hypothetical protein